MAMPGGLACAEVCRPPGSISRRLRPGRRCPLWNNKISRTTTTGKDKKVQSRVLYVSRNCSLLEPGLCSVGWELCITAAPFNRDDFLPVPTRRLEHQERYVCKYFEATVLARSVDGTKLLCPHVPGHLWRQHSPRAFLPTCTGCPQFMKIWQDAIGRWLKNRLKGEKNAESFRGAENSKSAGQV